MSSVAKIHTHFKLYQKNMRDIWESYNIVNFYMGKVHNEIRENRLPPLVAKGLYAKTAKQFSKNDVFGAISHLQLKGNERRTLIDCVGCFEHYLGELVTHIYTEFPGKLAEGQSNESNGREEKLINVILSSCNKEEMIDKLIEEKVRGIFYGNPVEFFEKDKAKLGFGNHFKSRFKDELEKYTEITARRNVITHNDGRVDRKYIREVKGTTLTLGKSVSVSESYLQSAIGLLLGLSAEVAALVVERIYNELPSGKIRLTRAKFQNVIDRGGFDTLNT